MANLRLKDNTWDSSGIYDTELEKTQKEINTDLDSTKADKTGNYSEMTVGTAEQLVGSSSVTDMIPYSFRKTGGDLTVGKRAEDMLVGGTVVWNQLVENGNFPSINGWQYSSGSATVSNNELTFTTDGSNVATMVYRTAAFLETHKVLVSYEIKGTVNRSRIRYPFQSRDFTVSSSYQTFCDIKPITSSDTVNLVRIGIQGIQNTASAGGTYTLRNVQAFDLTQMFGTTIADYIYNLEQTTAGAGVAFFRKLFPNDYYAYNAGELMSVKAVSHDTVGFNLWDEEWELGTIGVNGSAEGNNTMIRSKNYIPCFPSTAYKDVENGFAHSGNIVMHFYDENYNHITYDGQYAYNGGFNAQSGLFVTPQSAHYMRFRLASTYGTTYKNNICVNISDPTKNGTYEPYQKHTYLLDSSLELRGIPKLDANNKLYYDGDTYASDGTVTRKYGIVDLGSLTWSTGSGRFEATLYNISTNNEALITPLYKALNVSTGWANYDKVCSLYSPRNQVFIKDTSYSDAATFKSAMSGVYLVYELATPTTETAASYQNPQIVDPNGTEEYVDTRDVAIPAGHETKYYTDLVQKLEELPTDFSSIIAPTEKSTTASKPYAVGELLILNNVLYKVTSAIASGGTITPGTNVTATTLASLIAALS